MDNDLAENIRSLAGSLNHHKVAYMFVDGVATGFYGSPRPSTNLPKDIEYDIDVWY